MWSLVYPTALPQSISLCYGDGEQNGIVIRVPNSAVGADELKGVFIVHVCCNKGIMLSGSIVITCISVIGVTFGRFHAYFHMKVIRVCWNCLSLIGLFVHVYYFEWVLKI
jgi:hypothetical protein